MKLTLLGAGAWGTALAIAFAGKHAVTLWSREEDVAVDLRVTRENHRFFPGYRLPDAVRVESDFAAALREVETAWGGVHRYLHEAAGLDESKLASLRSICLGQITSYEQQSRG